MGNKVEGLLERKYGVDCSHLEPRPRGKDVEKMCRFYKNGGVEKGNKIVDDYYSSITPTSYELIECEGCPEGGSYSLIQRTMENGITQQTIVFEAINNQTELERKAKNIPRIEWV